MVNNSPVTSGVASGAIALNVGENIITTVVTVVAGTTQTYMVTVRRLALEPPTVSTSSASDLTSNSATLNGNMTSNGGETIMAKGFVYSTSNSDLTIAGATDVDVSDTEIGVFSKGITGLAASTPYYYKAYATNTSGTTYGGEQNFTTLAIITAPTVSTSSGSNLTSDSATLNGDVTSDGGGTIMERGFIYSSTISSDIGLVLDATDVIKESVDGTTGTFIKELTGLTVNTEYHYRAYVKNGLHTAYGGVQSFRISTLANKDFKLIGIYIYPNPTANILNITVFEKAEYRLLNIRGQTLKTGVLATGEGKIDISSFAKGVYLLNLKTDKGVLTKKVVKN